MLMPQRARLDAARLLHRRIADEPLSESLRQSSGKWQALTLLLLSCQCLDEAGNEAHSSLFGVCLNDIRLLYPAWTTAFGKSGAREPRALCIFQLEPRHRVWRELERGDGSSPVFYISEEEILEDDATVTGPVTANIADDTAPVADRRRPTLTLDNSLEFATLYQTNVPGCEMYAIKALEVWGVPDDSMTIDSIIASLASDLP